MTARVTRRAFGTAFAAGLLVRPGHARDAGTLTATWGEAAGRGGEPRALHVPSGGGPIATMVASKMLERLARRGIDSGAFIGVLAEGWRPSPDFTAYTIRLRRGVRFHDGTAMTADDVVFSMAGIWRKHAEPEAMEDVTGIEAIDASTVVVRWNRPVPPFAFGSLLCGPASFVVPRHLHDGADPRDLAGDDAPVGTGPFRLRHWLRGSRIELERNRDYWRGRPPLDRLVLRPIDDAADRAAALEAGEVQLALFDAVTPADARRLVATGRFVETARGYEEPGLATTLACNTRRSPLDSREVRQAIFHALDRPFIARSIFAGRARAGSGPILSTNKALFSADLHRLDHSPSRARALLDAAGHRATESRRFALTLVVADWWPTNRKVGAYVRQALGEIGVAVEIVVVDRPTALRRIYTDYDFDLALSNQANPCEPVPWTTRRYTSDGIRPGQPFGNASGHADPGLDRLAARIATETGIYERRDLVAEFQRVVARDAPLLPLVEHAPVTVAAATVRNHSDDANFAAASWHDLGLAAEL
ncbi:MAG: hypothetical protein KIT25_22220 [Enhydrobacter sp.]|nr:MAG: hypothetical protein KIT25_22220 [Enhydrobacter sp.]